MYCTSWGKVTLRAETQHACHPLVRARVDFKVVGLLSGAYNARLKRLRTNSAVSDFQDIRSHVVDARSSSEQ